MTADNFTQGDVLLYAGKGVFSRLIQIKTFSWVSHCEVYAGDGESLASRDGEGVGRYPLRLEGLYAVARPKGALDWQAGLEWFATVKGQRYDWLGLLNFYLAAKPDRSEVQKMFCSEFATRLLRRCGFEPFQARVDADRVSPGLYLTSAACEVLYVEETAERAPALPAGDHRGLREGEG